MERVIMANDYGEANNGKRLWHPITAAHHWLWYPILPTHYRVWTHSLLYLWTRTLNGNPKTEIGPTTNSLKTQKNGSIHTLAEIKQWPNQSNILTPLLSLFTPFLNASTNLKKTRPDTQQSSRGQLGWSSNAYTARDSEIFCTNRPTWQGVESRVRD